LVLPQIPILVDASWLLTMLVDAHHIVADVAGIKPDMNTSSPESGFEEAKNLSLGKMIVLSTGEGTISLKPVGVSGNV